MKSRFRWIAGSVVVLILIVLAYYRAGVLNLPSVPDEVTATDAGLVGLDEMKNLEARIFSVNIPSSADSLTVEVQRAVSEIEYGNERNGILHLQSLVRRNPANIVLGNLLRMETFKLTRLRLASNASQGEIGLVLPEYLDNQPMKFFRDLIKERPDRELKLQLALALVDHMLLFPALEIKAPASVESVEILSDILRQSDPRAAFYVPALYARGLNYLYRPFNLVWPERIATAPDAASKDLSLAVAIGQKVGGGSNALKAELSLALGDAYAKEGKLNAAHSWWQLANNLAHDDRIRNRVFTRLQWKDEEVAANLEATLEQQMNDTDHPLSDLRFMWR